MRSDPIKSCVFGGIFGGHKAIIDLIVKFESADINLAVQPACRSGETPDTRAITAWQAQRYRQAEDDVEAALASAPIETRNEPMAALALPRIVASGARPSSLARAVDIRITAAALP